MPPFSTDRSPSLLRRPPAELAFRVHGAGRDGQVIRLGGAKCSIGKADYCTLQLREPGLADVHCLILHGERQTVVRRWSEDTRLNGRGFDDAPLLPGDCLSIGPLDFELLPSPSGVPAQFPSAPDPVESAARRRRNRLRRRRRLKVLLESMRNERQQLHELQLAVAAGESSSRAQQADAARLRQLHDEFEQDKQHFAERQGALARRERDLAQQVTQWEADARDLEERRQQWLRDCEEQQARQAGHEADLVARQEQLARDEAALAEREHDWQAQATIRQLADGEQRAAGQQHLAELAEEADRLDRLRDELTAERTALEAASAELAQARQELQQAQADFEAAQQELVQSRQTWEEEQRELKNQREQLYAEQQLLQREQAAWQANLALRREAEATLPLEVQSPVGDARQHSPEAADSCDPVLAADCDAREVPNDPAANDFHTEDASASGLSTLELLSRYNEASLTPGDAAELLRDDAAELLRDDSDQDIFSRLRDMAVLRDADTATEAAAEYSPDAYDAPHPTEPSLAEPEAAGTYESSPVQAAATAGDEEDSIEQYMAGLLQRMRGEQAASPPAPHPVRPTTGPRSRAIVTEQAAEEKPAADWDPAQMSPRRAAPEQNVDIAKMRALANITTKSAIDASRHRRIRTEAVSKGLVSAICTMAGIVMIYLSPNVLSMGFLGGVAALVAGTNWAIRGSQLMRQMRGEQRRLQHAEALLQKAEQELHATPQQA